jgi:serine/threonine protein kinase
LKKQEYDKSVDWWCLGAVTYEMMYGLVSEQVLSLVYTIKVSVITVGMGDSSYRLKFDQGKKSLDHN